MPKRSSKQARPKQTAQLAKFLDDMATGRASLDSAWEGKNPAAVALGRKGGLKGGKARAAKLTEEQRRDIARRAAEARWGKKH